MNEVSKLDIVCIVCKLVCLLQTKKHQTDDDVPQASDLFLPRLTTTKVCVPLYGLSTRHIYTAKSCFNPGIVLVEHQQSPTIQAIKEI